MEYPVCRTECPREQEALDAIVSRRWPERADIDLRRHVVTCSVCADLIDVAAALADDHERASGEARIPPSAVVWWKAQVRARQEAARIAARPIAVAHLAAGIAAIGFAVAAAAAIWSWLPALPAVDLTPLAALAREHAPLMLLVLLPWLFLAPVAAWLAFARE
jgi:hypothetical protein